MRIRIAHRTDYRYDPPAAGVIQVLRLTPRNHEGQHVVRWRIDVSADARLAAHEDAFGNITHVFSADGPFSELSVEVDGEVETQNTNGIVRGTVERFGPSLFLRDTALTQADAAIRDFAQSIRAAKGGEILAELHGLFDRLYEDMAHEADDTEGAANAAEAFARKARPVARLEPYLYRRRALPRHSGALCRRLFPARATAATRKRRVTPGRRLSSPISAGSPSIRPTAFARPTAHVRVAIGLDSLGAAPVRRMRYGPGAETLAVAIKVGQ